MKLEKLYQSCFGVLPAKVVPLTKAGSNRRYYRLSAADGTSSAVGVIGTDKAENEAFIYLSGHFAEKSLPVPKVLAVSPDSMAYMQEDLGDTPLFELRSSTELLVKAIRELVRIQYLGAKDIDPSRLYPVSAFDSRCVLWDLNYFKYSFLNTVGISYSEPELQMDFDKMAEKISGLKAETFMYRDFQSRNVMVTPGGDVRFIDFQGGRMGPGVYDLVSFVRQARAAYPESVQQLLIDTYFSEIQKYEAKDRSEFDEEFRTLALLRSLQTLGAYGFRGRFERKPHFIKSIRPAIMSLQHLLKEPFAEYPHLMKILNRMIDKELGRLTVSVTSFSFKKGYPEDLSGNGGGFVFDCRAMNNPGRYEEYRTLTGRDKPVISFLESQGEVFAFLDDCSRLVDRSVENYISRSFTSLSVAFGCTGGRHRSLYCADRMARRLREKFPEIRIVLTHREQGISEEL